MKKLILLATLVGTAPAHADTGQVTITRHDQDGTKTIYKYTATITPVKGSQPTRSAPAKKPPRKPEPSQEDVKREWDSPGCRFWRQYLPPEKAREMLACKPWQALLK